jgi:hypothetical protein
MTNNNNKTLAQLLVGGILTSGLAICVSNAFAQTPQTEAQKFEAFQAQQRALYEKDPSSFDKVQLKGQVSQLGTPVQSPIHTKPLNGFAENLPLITVLKQITPNGWTVKKNDSTERQLNTQQSISWKGGNSWIQTLANIGNTYNLDFLINWNDNTITVSNAKIMLTQRKPTKAAVFELAGTNKTKDLGVGASEANNNPLPVATNKAISITPASQELRWTMVESKSLKENVEAWAQFAGYRLVWPGTDYKTDARVLTGIFDGPNGPISQLAKDYGFDEETGEPVVEQPLAFHLYQNRVLVVEDAVFEQRHIK